MCRRKDGPQNTCSYLFCWWGRASCCTLQMLSLISHFPPETYIPRRWSSSSRVPSYPVFTSPAILFVFFTASLGLPSLLQYSRASRTVAAIWDSLGAWGTLSRQVTSSPVTKFQLSTLPALAPLMASTTKFPAPSPLSPSLVQAVSSRCPPHEVALQTPLRHLERQGGYRAQPSHDVTICPSLCLATTATEDDRTCSENGGPRVMDNRFFPIIRMIVVARSRLSSHRLALVFRVLSQLLCCVDLVSLFICGDARLVISCAQQPQLLSAQKRDRRAATHLSAYELEGTTHHSNRLSRFTRARKSLCLGDYRVLTWDLEQESVQLAPSRPHRQLDSWAWHHFPTILRQNQTRPSPPTPQKQLPHQKTTTSSPTRTTPNLPSSQRDLPKINDQPTSHPSPASDP